VDCSLLTAATKGAGSLLAELDALGIVVVDVENIASVPGIALRKRPLPGGRTGNLIEIRPRDPQPPEAAEPSVPESSVPEPPLPEPAVSEAGGPPGLVVEDHVRSGQSILFPAGDVTVLGSVSSGAEVLAGGSIHIYGTLRGRALAGAQGFGKARIFCSRLEAELVSIDGFYRTAEDMDPALRGSAVQIWLEASRIMIAALR
jgi:septum site-determining protein MinC